jgi:hypothetical protein
MSKPTDAVLLDVVGVGTSRSGATTGGASRGTVVTGATDALTTRGGAGNSGIGAGGGALNTIIEDGVGRLPVAARGAITAVSTTTAWTKIENGTLDHQRLGGLVERPARDPNRSAITPPWQPARHDV